MMPVYSSDGADIGLDDAEADDLPCGAVDGLELRMDAHCDTGSAWQAANDRMI